MILCRGVIYHVPNTLTFTKRNVINHAPTKYHYLLKVSYFTLRKRRKKNKKAQQAFA
ncbi:Uncharacterised protein [Prevotella disiens]|uniref:Uncharacterized protein n=1 Tax=Prevotella disiens TaxID=28130 RepID=A0A379DYL9_9BACT|nr:Uncharacterised protein [Prevotella disiens]